VDSDQNGSREERGDCVGLPDCYQDIVTKILNHFNLSQMTTSLSDLVEGILIECLEGEENG